MKNEDTSGALGATASGATASESLGASKKELMDKLEKEGIQKVKQLNKVVNSSQEMMDALANIMKEGEKEFIEKTGRRMTYSEMREMYG
jgi:hypothetical protein